MRSLKASKPFSVNGSIILLPFSIKRSIKDCNVLELVDNFGFLISFFFDKFIC